MIDADIADLFMKKNRYAFWDVASWISAINAEQNIILFYSHTRLLFEGIAIFCHFYSTRSVIFSSCSWIQLKSSHFDP